jgi:flagella basal body P-ring formation protein FlgA
MASACIRAGHDKALSRPFLPAQSAVWGLVLFCFFLAGPLPARADSWSPEAEIRSYLLSTYPWADVDISNLEYSAELPAGRPVSITVEKTPPGNSLFRFKFRGGGTVLAAAHIRAFDRVVMTRSAFRKGYVLKPDDVYPTLMESGRIPKGALRSEEKIIGRPLLRSVVPNVPVTDMMVSDTALVRRGHKVSILVESAGFSIKALGEMKADAAVGDSVKALNLQSKKTVFGQLVDENTVRVEF